MRGVSYSDGRVGEKVGVKDGQVREQYRIERLREGMNGGESEIEKGIGEREMEER